MMKNKLSQGRRTSGILLFSISMSMTTVSSRRFCCFIDEDRKKGNLTRLKIAGIYDDVPNRSIKFTTQIIKQKTQRYPYPRHD